MRLAKEWKETVERAKTAVRVAAMIRPIRPADVFISYPRSGGIEVPSQIQLSLRLSELKVFKVIAYLSV